MFPASASDGPPLRLPVLFFVTAIALMFAAGALLAARGASALTSGWAPDTLALTHLGTLGVLTTTACGASYQLVPVLAGRAVRWPALAYATHALLSLGVLALVTGVLAPAPRLVVAAMALLGPFVPAFVVPASLGLRGSRDASASAMRLGQLALGLLALLGLWMAHGHSGGRFPGARAVWIQVHAGTAFLGWIGATIVGVSWRVVPMFFLSDAPSPAVRRASLVAIAVGVLTPIVLLATSGDAPPASWALGVAAAPAVLGVWVVHPMFTLRALRARRRPRLEPALVGWALGMASGLALGPLTLAVLGTGDPRAPLALGWLAITGWAGLVLHAMLLRIVPFVVWLHRHAAQLGITETPSVRQLLPDARAWPGLVVHGATVLVGLAAIGSESDTLARAAGVGLTVAAGLLGGAVAGALAPRARPVADARAT